MADAKDFLFEIGTEEMPSAPLNNAVKQLGTMIAKGLDEAGLAHGEVRVISSPRRLAALVANVATATDEVHEVKRGPAANIAFDADGNATKAAQGFARKCGVAAEDLVRREDTDGREYVFAEKNIPSAPATPILTALCEKTIAGLPVDAHYTVTEDAAEGYTTAVNGADGSKAEGAVTEDGATVVLAHRDDPRLRRMALFDALLERALEIEQLFRGDNGAIRVYASSTIGNYIMPEIIARYRHDFPELPVELSVGNSLDVINAVADRARMVV